MIPLISAFCFRSGGVGKNDRFLPFMKPPTPWANKWWRWVGIGIASAVFGLLIGRGAISFLSILTYFLVTNCCPYGEKSWLNFLGREGKWIAYGAIFGLASLPVLGWLAISQTMIASSAFFFLMKLSNDGVVITPPDGCNGVVKEWFLDQSIVEALFGFLGCVGYLFV